MKELIMSRYMVEFRTASYNFSILEAHMFSLFTIMVGQSKNVVGVNVGHITRL